MAKKTFIPANLRDALSELAEAVVPLDKWTKEKSYPPMESPVPWRPTTGAPTLSTKALNVVDYLEAYWSQLARDEAPLIERLREVQANPPQNIISTAWRQRRGMSSRGVFGAAESENTPLVELDESTNEHHVVGRADFYRECWEPLRRAIETYGSPDWPGLAKWMHRGEFGPRLSEFVHLFAIDVLRAVMNQDSKHVPAPAYPYQAAVLIELGEGRRVGMNASLPDGPLSGKHTNEEVAEAVHKLESLIPVP
jgi:hypothetical protein